MRSRNKALAALLGLSLFTTGCWDREELNDRAIVLGWGLDLQEDGTYLGTANIVLPKGAKAGGGAQAGGEQGGSNSFMTESATGRNNNDVAQNMQKKLSRTIFPGHRRNIFIGEKLARHGIAGVLDEYSRNPTVRPRTNIFVVQGGTAQQVMSLGYQLETNPAIAVQKTQEKMGAPVARSLVDFYMMANGPGCAVMPTLRIVQPEKKVKTESKDDSPPKPTLEHAGVSIFDRNFKLKGYLDTEEFWVRLWLVDKLKRRVVTGVVDEEDNNFTITMDKFKREIKSEIKGDKISFDVKLKGMGTLNENNSTLDLSRQQNIFKAERIAEKGLLQQIEPVVEKVQQDFKCDVFEFGDTLHRQHPRKWKDIESRWEELFPKAEVKLSVKINITDTGSTDKSLLPKKMGGPEQ